MITLTRLTGQRFALNPDLIERVEATPDTVISLVDGSRHVVTEDIDTVVERVRRFRASVVALSQTLVVAAPSGGPTGGSGTPTAPPLRLISEKGGE